jgi:beta-lactamase regulating signal transducer with metallopeptidase domain
MMEATLETLTGIATFILFASLKSTVLVGLVLAAQKVFAGHLSANGRYLLWLAVVISLVTPVGFAISLPNLPAFHASAETGLAAQVPVALEGSTVRYADTHAFAVSPPSSVDGASLRWDSALSLLWLSGLILVITAMTLSSRRFTTLARHGNPAPESVQRILRQCEQQAGCLSAIRLVSSPDLRAPVVAGLLEPVLLWPAGLEALLTPTQLQHVLMHEVIHVKRRDIFSACVVAALQALHWFNPAIWIAFSWLRQDREMACDAATVRTLQSCDAHDYAHTLIQLGALRPGTVPSAPGLGILDSHAQLRRRIHMLAQLADPSARHFLTGLLLLAFSAFAFSQPATAPRMEEAPAPLPMAEIAVLPQTPTDVAIETIVEQEPIAAALVPAAQATPRAISEISPATEAPAARVVTEPVQESFVTPANAAIVIASADIVSAVPPPIQDRALIAAQIDAAAPSTSASVEQRDALICRRQDLPGSRIRSRVCLTEAQWAAAEGLAPRSHAFTRSLSPTDFDGGFNSLSIPQPDPNWSSRTRSAAPLGEASEEESVRVVCRAFSSREAGPWHACDSESNWATFARGWGVAPETLPEVEGFPPRGAALSLQDEVCRNRSREASFMKDRVCSSAAQWAAIDMAETGACWSERHSGDFRGVCSGLAAAAKRRDWNQIGVMPLTMPSN